MERFSFKTISTFLVGVSKTHFTKSKIFFFILVLTILFLCFRNSAFSIFFHGDLSKHEKSFVGKYNFNLDPFYYKEKRKRDFCVVIPTVKRSKPYLKMLLESIIMYIDPFVKLFVYDCTNPNDVNDDVIDIINKYGDVVNVEKEDNNIFWDEEIGDDGESIWALKQSRNYAESIDLCLNDFGEEYEYILVLEDDSVATRDVFKKIRKFVEQIDGEWVMIKLFISDYINGWEFGDIKLSFLLLFIIIIVLYLGTFKMNKRSRASFILNWSIYIWILLNCSFYLVGKPNVFWEKRGIRELKERRFEKPGSWVMSVSYLYNPKFARELVEYIKTPKRYNTCNEVDNLIIEFYVQFIRDKRRENGEGKAYQIYPNLFQHVGIVSSEKKTNTIAKKEYVRESNHFEM